MNGEAVQRYPTVTKLPPMLQIYFQRQDFDVQRSESYMINHHVQLEDVIYMDRYISSSKPEVQALRQQSWDLKHKVRKLQDKRSRHDIKGKLGVTGPDTLDATWQFINKHGEDLGSDQDLLDDLKTVADLKRSEMERLNNQIVDLQTNINRLFAQFEDTPYRLAAIFVHRGDTKGGHYWIYIRDYTKNIWRRYEDRDVRELLDQAEVFAEGDPQIQGAPYFVVYVRDGEKDDLVEALWRVAQEKGEEVADILMDDVQEPEEGKVVVEKTEDEDDATKAYHG
jgi:ubiquitin carboxyl-terminal hydrolase 25/28